MSKQGEHGNAPLDAPTLRALIAEAQGQAERASEERNVRDKQTWGGREVWLQAKLDAAAQEPEAREPSLKFTRRLSAVFKEWRNTKVLPQLGIDVRLAAAYDECIEQADTQPAPRIPPDLDDRIADAINKAFEQRGL